MLPFEHFTSRARDVIRRAHELAVERGVNQVNQNHLTLALLMQEDSVIYSIFEVLDVDGGAVMDALMETLEGSDVGQTLSPSFHIYLTPELAQVLEQSGKAAKGLGDEFVGVEHLFLALLGMVCR